MDKQKVYTFMWCSEDWLLSIVDVGPAWIPYHSQIIYLTDKTMLRSELKSNTWNPRFRHISCDEFCKRYNITIEDILKAVK